MTHTSTCIQVRREYYKVDIIENESFSWRYVSLTKKTHISFTLLTHVLWPILAFLPNSKIDDTVTLYGKSNIHGIIWHQGPNFGPDQLFEQSFLVK